MLCMTNACQNVEILNDVIIAVARLHVIMWLMYISPLFAQ